MQLTVLGYVLVPIFTYNMWWLVLLYACFMLFVGCMEAVSRPQYTYRVSTPLEHLCSGPRGRAWQAMRDRIVVPAQTPSLKNPQQLVHLWRRARVVEANAIQPVHLRTLWWLQGMLLQALLSLGSSAAVFLTYTLTLVVRTSPWWQPQARSSHLPVSS